MALISRIPVVWTGLTALPGVSVFYWDFTVSPDVSDLVTFFDDIKNRFPTGLSWQIPGSGDQIEDSTGALGGSWIATGSGTVSATGGTSSYAAGVGMRVKWRTSGIFNGRRVVGSTFLAPMLGSIFDTDGTPSSAVVSSVQTAADALVTNGGLVIWSRPVPGGSNGDSNAVTAAVTPDRATSLRSRRY